MPRFKALPLKVRAEALRLRDTGAAYATIAATCAKRFKLPVSEAVVRKWCKVRDSEAAETTAADNTPAPVADALAALGAPIADDAAPVDPDTIAELRALLSEQRQLAKTARLDGNTTAAARALKAAGDAANTLARLEDKRRSGAGQDDLIIPRAEYARIEKELLDRVAALASDLDRTGGIACSECGRKIRIKLASEPKPPTE